MANNNQSFDDATNSGTPTAPAYSASEVNVQYAGSPDSNNQKVSKTGQTVNFKETALRRWNPLSKLSSYTYCLTLYMVTPECSNFFAENGKMPPNNNVSSGRYFIVARSGGMNSDRDPRALTMDSEGKLGPGVPGLDFMIDDLSFDVYMLGADGQRTPTTATTFSFKVVEPLGFTFLTKLSKASNQINKLSNLIGDGPETSKPNLYQQHYMLGIKFYGYDASGNVIESDKFEGSDDKVTGDKFAIFERIFPIIGSKVSFAINGRAATYTWEAVLTNHQTAFGSKRGLMQGVLSAEGATVGEVIGGIDGEEKKSILQQLNNFQQTAKINKNISIPTVYKVDWGNFTELKNSSVVTTQDRDLKSTGGSGAESVEESNVATSQQNQTVKTTREFKNFTAGTAIVAALDQVIVTSSYITDKLIKENKARVEAESENNNITGKLQWYAINPVVKVIKRDLEINDWAYEVTYQMLPYEIPYIKSQYVGVKSKYYGPVKRYDFTYTGQNTEIITFELDYNNSYYTVTTPNTTVDRSAANKRGGKVTPVALGPSNSAPTSGNVNNANVVSQNVRANLYSIADQAIASFKVMGDPDLIMDSVGYKVLPSSTFGKFYSGVNQTISPYGGQLFIEVVFGVAEDYKESTGLLDLDPNEIIAFYPLDQQRAQGSNGIIYKIIKVSNSFSRGKFEQVLECHFVPTPELIFSDDPDGSYERAENARFARQGTGARQSGVNQPEENTTDQTGSQSEPTVNGDPLNTNSESTPTNTGSTTNDDNYIDHTEYYLQEESGR